MKETLPEYFEEWNRLSSDSVFTRLIDNHGLRSEINKMPVLDYTRLRGHRQFRLAHLQLSVLAAGYVWQDGDEGVPKTLPRCVAVPYCGVSRVLEVQPVLSHCDLALANWRVLDKDKPYTLDNIRILYGLPGGEEAKWFFQATVGVELAFCPALQSLISGMEAAETSNDVTLESCLNKIAETVRKMKEALSKMHDGLSADTFYNITRPFLTGWGGNGSPLPDGLVYEGVDDKPIQMNGGSAAQSSTVQCIDAALGVEHVPEIKSFFDKMKSYMPKPHRQFIENVRERTKILSFVNTTSYVPLKRAYQSCIQALVDFRSYHIQIVTKYIIIASSRKRQEDEKYKSVSKTGTGGSSILPFLRSAREATKGNNSQV